MMAHLHDPDRPLLSLCGTPLLGIEPRLAPGVAWCLDLDDDFLTEDRQVVALGESTPACR
jgi:hypothetical protein